MAAIPTLSYLAFGGAVTGVVVVSQELATNNGQNWTLLGLVAVLTVGIGGKMISALVDNTKATNSMATAQQNSANAIAALTLELRTLISQNAQEARDVHDELNDLPLRIAEHLRGKLP